MHRYGGQTRRRVSAQLVQAGVHHRWVLHEPHYGVELSGATLTVPVLRSRSCVVLAGVVSY